MVKKVGGKDQVLEILRGDLEFAVKRPDLLKRINVTKVPGVQRFVAEESFPAANVGRTGDNFNHLFLKKVEENIDDIAVVSHRLERASLDASIIAQLGERAEISLVHLFSLLESQSRGQEGFLLVNGYANIAYIRDAEGVLWAVHASWDSDCGYWIVGAHSVGRPGRWVAGNLVLSRDS